ncbi:MAG: ribosome biogenesis GTPase Der, partial [Gemmataceae bacterium]|nr:ribosome biogenesis GTPase Der [Gemmataceae bacterium]
MSSGAAQLPVVAIVGRPNVGKSSLFNYLAGRRISIVDPTAGVTRDRVATVVEAEGRYFELVDTGGVGIVDRDDLSADVERQINYALAEAAVVVFVVDVRSGLAPLDWEVAERLRPWSKPVILVANKADTEALAAQVGEFYRLGFGDPLAVSAEQRRGKDELLAAILARLPTEAGSTAPEDVALKLAIVGRRNVGKSTFINSLAQTERVIVSEVPGTTRDSIDVRFQRDGKTFLAIDTAGVRKRSAIADDIEFYSLHRAQRSIRRADVVLHFFDARHRIGRVDKQLADYILQEHKPAIFVINKWDLVKNVLTTERMADYVRRVFPMLEYVPIAFITARNGKNVLRVL